MMTYTDDIRDPVLKVNDDKKIQIHLAGIRDPGTLIVLCVKEFDNTWEQEYNKRFGANAWDYDRDAFDESIEMIVGQQVQTLELVESMMPDLK